MHGEAALLIVVAHGGSLLTFHSLHDGRLVHSKSLSLGAPGELDPRISSVTDMWWIKHDTIPKPAAFKDVFDRKEIVRRLLCAHFISTHLEANDSPERRIRFSDISHSSILYNGRRYLCSSPFVHDDSTYN